MLIIERENQKPNAVELIKVVHQVYPEKFQHENSLDLVQWAKFYLIA